MRKFCKHLVIGLLLTIFSAGPGHATTCAPLEWPLKRGEYLNPKLAWFKSDTGIVVSSFVGLGDGPSGVTHHGVDVSQNNSMNVISQVRPCGGEFAFVELDNAFDTNAKALKSATIIPYDYFGFGKDRPQYSRDFSGKAPAGLSDDRFEKLVNETYQTITEWLSSSTQQDVSFVGLQGRLVAIDMETKLADQTIKDVAPRQLFGESYAKALCKLQAQLNAAHVTLMIFTTPSMWSDYFHYALSPDTLCIQTDPVWISWTTPDGGDWDETSPWATRVKDPTTLNWAHKLCSAGSAGSRCIVHQYTNRGILGQAVLKDDPKLPHVDLDRFRQARVVKTNNGPVVAAPQ